MSDVHVLVWVDQQRARLIELSNGESHSVRIGDESTPLPVDELHERIAAAIDAAVEIVVSGPGNGRLAFVRHLQAAHPVIAKRVIGVEQIGPVTDTMLRMYARTYFRLSERVDPRST